MLKKSLLYLGLSALVVIFAPYGKQLLIDINMLYTQLNQVLKPWFGATLFANSLRDTLTLILTPLLLASIPALIYWLFKRKQMPYWIDLTWIFWLILAFSNYLIE